MISIRTFKNLDYLLLLAVVLLLIIGCFVLYSASLEERAGTGVDYTQKQVVWTAVAIIVFFVMLFVDYHFFLNISYVIYGITIVLLIGVLFIGDERYGARRWLGIGGFTLQPSELAKLGVIFVIVKYLAWDIENRKTLRYIIVTMLILSLPLMLIFRQPDLGTALIFLPTILILLFVSGMSWLYVIAGGILAVLGMPLCWNLLRDYQKRRIICFINPESDPLGSGYSVIQSKIAIGSGGIFGKGWLSGTQNRLNFIPERHTDFIFSVIGEEWGFFGAIVVLVLFFIIIASGFNIVRKAPDTSGQLLALGIITIFTVQVSVNIGMTIGLLPVTGIPLPFMSYGGTNLVVTMGMMGILQNIYVKRYMF